MLRSINGLSFTSMSSYEKTFNFFSIFIIFTTSCLNYFHFDLCAVTQPEIKNGSVCRRSLLVTQAIFSR